MIKIDRGDSLVVIQVHNHYNSVVHIHWIEPDSKQEKLLGSIKAGSSMDLNGYHGNEYVVWDFNLKEYKKFTIDDAHGDNQFFYVLPIWFSLYYMSMRCIFANINSSFFPYVVFIMV